VFNSWVRLLPPFSLHYLNHILQEVTLVKEGGSLGFSIIGGTDHSCTPFGASEPGICISHVSKLRSGELKTYLYIMTPYWPFSSTKTLQWWERWSFVRNGGSNDTQWNFSSVWIFLYTCYVDPDSSSSVKYVSSSLTLLKLFTHTYIVILLGAYCFMHPLLLQCTVDHWVVYRLVCCIMFLHIMFITFNTHCEGVLHDTFIVCVWRLDLHDSYGTWIVLTFCFMYNLVILCVIYRTNIVDF
jgi:hypothetical protein